MAAVAARRRVPYDEALAVARDAMALLTPACERLEIAGSLRRQRPSVGDIELLAVPRLRRVTGDLFGEVFVEVDELHDLAASLVATDVLAHRRDAQNRMAFGRRFKRLVFQHVALDLFCVLPPAQWGVLSVLRTGPATFSRHMVTPRREGGFLPWGFRVDGGALHNGQEVVSTPEEQDYFAALGLPFLEPEHRTDTIGLRGGRAPQDRWRWVEGPEHDR